MGNLGGKINNDGVYLDLEFGTVLEGQQMVVHAFTCKNGLI